MPKQQTKADAVKEIICDSHAKRHSYASYQRVKYALDTLGIHGDEQNSILVILEYHSHVSPSIPHPRYQKPRVQRKRLW